MIISLDTSTPTCRLGIYKDGAWQNVEWEAGRDLAKGLLRYLSEQLAEQGSDTHAISGIVAYQGPGSFTGLRIGLTVVNTLADAQHIPIVGATGDDWQSTGLARLQAGENDQLVMPEYGGVPNITTPRK